MLSYIHDVELPIGADMPFYTFENIETGEQFQEMLSWEDSKKYLEDNPHLKRVIGAPKIVSSVGRPKVTESFKEAVARVKENCKVNNIRDF